MQARGCLRHNKLHSEVARGELAVMAGQAASRRGAPATDQGILAQA